MWGWVAVVRSYYYALLLLVASARAVRVDSRGIAEALLYSCSSRNEAAIIMHHRVSSASDI